MNNKSPHDRREHGKTDEDKIFRGKAGATRVRQTDCFYKLNIFQTWLQLHMRSTLSKHPQLLKKSHSWRILKLITNQLP